MHGLFSWMRIVDAINCNMIVEITLFAMIYINASKATAERSVWRPPPFAKLFGNVTPVGSLPSLPKRSASNTRAEDKELQQTAMAAHQRRCRKSR